MNDIDRSRGYDREAYQNDADLEAYEYDEEESGVRMPLFVILALVVVAALIGVYFVAEQRGYERGLQAASETRTIAANPDAARTRPDNPGGQPAPQERDVFNRLDGSARQGGEQVRPRQEQIVDVPSASTQTASTRSGGSSATSGTPGGVSVPRPGDVASAARQTAGTAASNVRTAAENTANAAGSQLQQAANAARNQATNTVNNAANTATTAANTAARSAGSVIVPPPSSRLRQNPPAPSGSPSTSTATQPSAGDLIGPRPAPGGAAPAVSSGNFVVQVASSPSREAVQTTWSRLQARYSDLLGRRSPDIETADLGARGIYHRLRIGYFPSRDSATALCSQLKARGQDCLVKTR